MKVRAVRRFNDLSAGIKRAKGDEFDVSKKRAEELQATTFGALVEPVVEPKKSKKPETPEDAKVKPETPEDAE